MTTQYQPLHWGTMLALMMKSAVTLRRAATCLRPEFFTDPQINSTRGQSIIFGVMKDYFDRYGKVPDRSIMTAEVYSVCTRYWPGGSPEMQTVYGELQYLYDGLLPTVTTASEGVINDAIDYMYKTCYRDVQARQLIGDAMMTSDLEGLTGKLSALANEAGAALGGNSRIIGISNTVPEDSGERVKTGIPFFDKKFGNGLGFVNGSAVGIIAPQGAGKTTLGIQFVVEQAMMDNYAMLILVEEGYTAAIRRRIVAATTGIPGLVLAKHNDDIMAAAASMGLHPDATAARVARMDKYIIVIDMVKNSGESLGDVERHIDQAIAEGRAPKVVYLDWTGYLADRVVAFGYNGLKFDKSEPAIRTVTKVLANVAATRNLLFFISQQMANPDARKGPYAVHTVYCALDCKAFSIPLKYCIVVNGPDQRTNIQLMQVPKSRDDLRIPPFLVKMDGSSQVFTEVTTHELRGKRIVESTKQDTEHKLPSQHPPGGHKT